MKKKGRPEIPFPKTPIEAANIGYYGAVGLDSWMDYLTGNPFLQAELMTEGLSKSNPHNLTLRELQKRWALRFGLAVGKALQDGNVESIERFCQCAKAVLSKRNEPFSDPSGYDIASLYSVLCWTENRPIDKSGFVAYCKKSSKAIHRNLSERQIDRLLKWARAGLGGLKVHDKKA